MFALICPFSVIKIVKNNPVPNILNILYLILTHGTKITIYNKYNA